MKKLVMLTIVGLFIFSYVAIMASNKPAEQQEPYDEDTYGPEAPIVWSSPVKTVIFNHKTHTMDNELDCESCHDEMFEMEAGAAEANDDFTMASMGEGLYCEACHDGSTAFAYDAECSLCHQPPEELVVWTKPVKAVVFSHETHTADMGLDCSSCHDDLFVMKNGAAQENDDFTMASLYEGNYCGACHDGSTAFASDTLCTTCHIGVRGLAKLTGEGEKSSKGAGH
jgi:c(7)-type cytochrome triheme protein